MSLRREDDWDEALEEARDNAIARGELVPAKPFIPGPDYDWGQSVEVDMREHHIVGVTGKVVSKDWPEWMPISTAPKEDRARILMYEKCFGVMVGEIFVNSQGEVDYMDGDTYISPTHWMPLPDEPIA